MSTILLTGIAGFIGYWTALELHRQGYNVVGLDNFSPYYDVGLKRARVKNLKGQFKIYEVDLSDRKGMEAVFKENKIDQVCHLAAQAGVRYSLTDPLAYETSNNLGTLHLLEACRQFSVPSFIYASSSSVYGGNKKTPFSESDPVDHPISLYAATKKYIELIAHTYHHLFGIHCTGLRLFTVYGPWGRPDMALFKFTDAIQNNKPIDVYNQGKMKRDFTYVTDVVDGIVLALKKNAAYEIYNIGNSKPVDLMTFIECLEKELGKKAEKNFLPLQPGDVVETYADIKKAQDQLGYQPKMTVEAGVKNFIAWFNDYYR